MDQRRLHTRESLLSRRRRRRQTHVRRRAAAVAVLAVVLTLGVVAITSGSGKRADDVAPFAVFGKRARIFPRVDRVSRMPYVAVAGKRKREIALTFDDGPGPYTSEVVRTLRRLVGAAEAVEPLVAERMDADRHQRGAALELLGVREVVLGRADLEERSGRAEAAQGADDL